MEEEQTKASTNKTTQKEQKKSEKDKNGIIGGLVFGAMAVFATYQIYDKFFEFAIGKILVYILGVLAFICFAVSISSFFDFKESKDVYKRQPLYQHQQICHAIHARLCYRDRQRIRNADCDPKHFPDGADRLRRRADRTFRPRRRLPQHRGKRTWSRHRKKLY